jgi:hypothetical protein
MLLPRLVSYLGTLKIPPQLRGTVLQVLAAPIQRKGSLLIPTEARRSYAWPFSYRAESLSERVSLRNVLIVKPLRWARPMAAPATMETMFLYITILETVYQK